MIPGTDQYINLHAHRTSASPQEWVITNLFAESLPVLPDENANYSVGLHPWHIATSDVATELKKVALAAGNRQVLAIGETGPDRAIETSPEEQMRVFEAQVELAEQNNLAVIVHAVRSWDELTGFMKAHRPAVPLIIHGFTGAIRVVEQLLREGFFLSFGEALLRSDKLREVMTTVPVERLFLETDESMKTIEEIYQLAAAHRDISVDYLKQRMRENVMRVLHRLTH